MRFGVDGGRLSRTIFDLRRSLVLCGRRNGLIDIGNFESGIGLLHSHIGKIDEKMPIHASHPACIP